MEKLIAISHFLVGPAGFIVASSLFALSEALAETKKIPANSVTQLLLNALKSWKDKSEPKAQA